MPFTRGVGSAMAAVVAATAMLVSAGTAAARTPGRPAESLAGGPVIKKVAPRKGPAAGGSTVRITGSGFTAATAVMFGAQAASEYTVLSDSTITAVSPAETTGAVELSVTTAVGTSPPTSKAKYAFEAPTVSSVAPARGSTAGGVEVTVTGSGFALGSGTSFTFGKALALEVNCSSVSSCTMVVPAAAKTGAVAVLARVGAKHSKATVDQFTYVTPAEAEQEAREARERQELKEREEREARERQELKEREEREARERHEREEREARERREREEREARERQEQREREEHAPSITASKGGPDRGGYDLDIQVHNFPTGTFTYYCHDNSGPGGSDVIFYQHAVTVTNPNQDSWPGVFCYDSAPYVAYLVMDGIRSNSVVF